MAELWQTIEQAAVTLGLSVRTVNRRITDGKLQSRLLEGRREVLIPQTGLRSADGPSLRAAPFATASVRAGTDYASTVGQDNGNGTQTATTSDNRRSTDAGGGGEDADARLGGGSLSEDGGWDGSAIPQGGQAAARDGGPQRVTPEVARESNLDLQTMLALTDSIDDKATLAVAAYQTLARSAETQVQSLRRVALGAWAAVGVMAVGVIVGVGWGVRSLTTAEMSASNMQDRVAREAEAQRQRSVEHAEELRRLTAERDAAQRERTAAASVADELRGRTAELAKQVSYHQQQAELSAAALRQQAATRPTAGVVQGSSATPAPGPAATATSDNRAVTASSTFPPPVSRPAGELAGKPPVPQSPRPTNMVNPNDGTFGPR